MSKRRLVLLALGIAAAMAVSVAAAMASNVSHPATYTGTVVGGGTVEFDVSADGSAVTRFVGSEISVPPCGTVSSTTTGTIPIINDSFSSTSGTVRFRGTFSAIQKAEGSISFHSSFPSCTSKEVPWTATTPTPPPDETPPNTKITSGPQGTTHKHKATFRFTSTEPGSTFRCKLDGKKWANCKSPRTYGNLKDGKHTFKVKATDAAGNVDPTPAKRSWRVD